MHSQDAGGSNTYESTKPEGPQWHIDDGAGNVDEPVWEEWCDAKEDDVEEQVISLFVHFFLP